MKKRIKQGEGKKNHGTTELEEAKLSFISFPPAVHCMVVHSKQVKQCSLLAGRDQHYAIL